MKRSKKNKKGFDPYSPRFRNLSRNTIKLLMRPTNAGKSENQPGWRFRYSNYQLHNWGGASLWRMSKGKVCNVEPKGWLRYVPAKNREATLERCNGWNIGKP